MYFSLKLSAETAGLQRVSREEGVNDNQFHEQGLLLDDGFLYEQSFDGIHFMYLNLNRSLNGNASFTIHRPIFQIIYSSKCDFHIKSGSSSIDPITENCVSILYLPSNEYEIVEKEGKPAELFSINLGEEYFLRLLPSAHPLRSSAKSCADNNFSSHISGAIPVNAPMKILLQEILNCKKHATAKRLFTEARIIELIMLYLEQYELLVKQDDECGDQKTDVEKMYQVRNILRDTLSTPCSLIDLAHRVGTNEFNLKRDFKRVFGTTVFKYAQNLRMEKARELLLKGNKNISEIAYLVGYQHATHFTAAFKKHFGYIPRDIKV